MRVVAGGIFFSSFFRPSQGGLVAVMVAMSVATMKAYLPIVSLSTVLTKEWLLCAGATLLLAKMKA